MNEHRPERGRFYSQFVHLFILFTGERTSNHGIFHTLSGFEDPPERNGYGRITHIFNDLIWKWVFRLVFNAYKYCSTLCFYQCHTSYEKVFEPFVTRADLANAFKLLCLFFCHISRTLLYSVLLLLYWNSVFIKDIPLFLRIRYSPIGSSSLDKIS